MVRSSLKFVSWKDYKELTKDLKMIYQASTEEQALQALAHFEEIWDDKYPPILVNPGADTGKISVPSLFILRIFAKRSIPRMR